MFPKTHLFLQRIKEAAANTVSGAFEQFLDKEINIAKGQRSQASTSQNHLREFLVGESDRDPTFPRILSEADSDFLGGSFARYTKIWPLDDIDVYLPLDGFDLIYAVHGQQMPHTVVSDGVLTSNPLLNPRWMNGEFISSKKIVDGFAGVLMRHYPKKTKVRPSGQAVSVEMVQGKTILTAHMGLGFDVVPCFSMRPHNQNEWPFYMIPDGADGWIRTNPKIDAEISDDLQSKNDKTYRKVVKLIKYWNENKLKQALKSYYIELVVMRAYLARNNAGEFIRSVSYGLAIGFSALNQAVFSGNQQSWIPGAPSVSPGDMPIIGLKSLFLKNVAEKSNEAWSAELAGRKTDAIHAWGQIFGPAFPTLSEGG